MHLDQILTASVLLLGASAVAIALFQRAGLGSVLGLLCVGVLLGPHTIGPVVNIGPWGRDYHQKWERVHMPYAFDVLPDLIYEAALVSLAD